MKSILCVLLTFLATGTSFSQSGWISQQSGVTSQLNDVSFISSQKGTAVGNNSTILCTTDAGTSWKSHAAWGDVYSVSFLNSNIETAVGNAYRIGDGYIGTLTPSTDGGLSWNSWFLGSPPLIGISCIDTITTIVIGNGGVIGRRSESGWYAYDPYITHATLRGISFADKNTGIIVGDSGIVLRTTNKGDLWMRQSSGTSETLRGVSMADVNNVFVVGDNGTILHTKDGGITWGSQSSGTLDTLRGVSAIDANTAFVVGDSGIILRTTDGGNNWKSQASGTFNTLRGVSAIDANNAFVVGDSGIILHTTTGGITSIAIENTNQLPEKFILMQNYPNPFNPTTTIDYSIPKESFVTIKIYDLVGREVKTLVNEEKNVGEYKVKFDGNNLASGIYFYRMKAGGFIQTKKLVLIR